jgi:hypothetical protein
MGLSLHDEGEGLCTVLWTVCAERGAPPRGGSSVVGSIADFNALLGIVHR